MLLSNSAINCSFNRCIGVKHPSRIASICNFGDVFGFCIAPTCQSVVFVGVSLFHTTQRFDFVLLT